MGHLANLAPIAQRLESRGHTLHLAMRDLSLARFIKHFNVRLWQSPFKNSRAKQAVAEPRTFADILFNCGFGSEDELLGLVRAWQEIFAAVRPDVIVAEHSPSALLAARAMRCPTVLVGTGFCNPPGASPWHDLRPWLNRPALHAAAIEEKVLTHCNAVLEHFHATKLSDLPSLFAAEAVCLQTIPELDPFSRLPTVTYHGAWPHWGGKTPRWPAVSGKRIFCYLKPFPALPQLLSLLAELHQPTIVVCDGIDRKLQQKFTRPWLQFENEPLDMRLATQQCAAAICNANHGTTLALLEAGKPALYLPLHLEQTLTALAVQKLGTGLIASIRRPEQISIRLLKILESQRYTAAATQLKSQWPSRSSEVELMAIVQKIEAISHGARLGSYPTTVDPCR